MCYTLPTSTTATMGADKGGEIDEKSLQLAAISVQCATNIGGDT